MIEPTKSKSKLLQLAVTEFALPCPRTGHIEQDSGYGGAPNLGVEIHQKIQADRLRENSAYIPEKWVTHTFETEGYKIQVSGRIDGVALGARAALEEIKSTYNIDGLEQNLKSNSQHPYWLQVKTYGYLHWIRTDEIPELRLIVVCSRTLETRVLAQDFDPTDYQNWLKLRLKEINLEQTAFEAAHAKRKKLAPQMRFPFSEARAGQKELIATIAEKLNGKTQLLLQAPTGLGKTMGVLFPTLQESFRRGQKTIYLTAKNSQHTVAEDAVERLQESGLKIRSVTLTAKRKMCLKEETLCNPQYCEFAKNYYDKLAQQEVVERLDRKKRLTPEAFKKMGRKYEVCPFELQLESLPKADVVICDYNYAYSPRNVRGRLLQNGYSKTSPPNVVIDEAHNLPARAAEYFSAKLGQFDLQTLSDRADHVDGETRELITRLVGAANRLFYSLSGDGHGQARIVSRDEFDLTELSNLAREMMARFMASGTPLKSPDPVFEIFNLVTGFEDALMNLNEAFFLSFSRDLKGPYLKITCCDASDWLKESHMDFENIVAFSATMKPFDYFSQLLGFKGEVTSQFEFHSPFPEENRKIIIIPQVSTKMRDRESNAGRIREVIERVAQLKPGNYFVFFPSFDFMNQIAKGFSLPGFQILLQRRDMNLTDIQNYLESLQAQSEPTLIFAVQGGVFAEGVDYPGDMLIGAIIVGPALPTFDFEREQIRAYFDKKYDGRGFDYAYTYPAMSRVVQSAGRVIRSPQDRGLIVLMDRRFTHESYVKSMPSDWLNRGGLDALVSRQILEDVRQFWSYE